MANSKYEYVRLFEQPDILLANTWIVVRIDGRGFSKFTAKYKFMKPNDRRALDLMNAAAEGVMKELPDLVLGYGVSDEYSFVFHKDCVLFERRASKLTTTIVSTFSSYYTFLWPQYFSDTPLTPPLPSFDGRAVCYPSDQNLRDYMSWRQVDCHINNLYNTTFWALVQDGGMDPRVAEQELAGTVSSDKNEILFSRFGINYNNEPEIFKKGSVIYRDVVLPSFRLPTPTPPRIPSANSSPPPPLSHPQPRIAQRLSLPILPKSNESSEGSTPRGPTFLSTSTTPSPPPSSTALSFPAIPSFPQTLFPVTSNTTPTPGSKPALPQLIPLPLPPPTLTPSTGPPASLNPPAVTNMRMISRAPPPTTPIIPNRTVSSNAVKLSSSASSSPKPNARPGSSCDASNRTPARPATLKHRSPSLSVLEGGAPPQIPLRISSIPLGSAPRKLSLPSQRSFKSNGKSNGNGNGNGNGLANSYPNDSNSNTLYHPVLPPTPSSSATAATASPTPSPSGPLNSHPLYSRYAISSPLPPLQTMKQLPAPPPQSPDSPTIPEPRNYSHSHSHSESIKRRERSCSHTRMGSAPLLGSPGSGRGEGGGFEFVGSGYEYPVSENVGVAMSVPSKSKAREVVQSPSYPQSYPSQQFRSDNMRGNGSKRSSKIVPSGSASPGPSSAGPSNINTNTNTKNLTLNLDAKVSNKGKEVKGNQGRPQELSRTQKDKERKKRSKARIVIEHVDMIKDEFWERRPWILSGRAGA